MLAKIENSANSNSIKFSYNDLTAMPEVVFSERTVSKNQIVYIALEKEESYVEISLAHDQIFQLTNQMVSVPSCSSNKELYSALSAMLA